MVCDVGLVEITWPSYILPRLRIDTRSQNPITPAKMKPARPIMGISFHFGGMSERMMREDPIMSAARTMAKAMRLLVRSWVKSIGSSPLCSNSIFTLPSLACLRIVRTSLGISFRRVNNSAPVSIISPAIVFGLNRRNCICRIKGSARFISSKSGSSMRPSPSTVLSAFIIRNRSGFNLRRYFVSISRSC